MVAQCFNAGRLFGHLLHANLRNQALSRRALERLRLGTGMRNLHVIAMFITLKEYKKKRKKAKKSLEGYP